jgi:ubiquinone/menaquinone biosynthesis C-methylase UbiE
MPDVDSPMHVRMLRNWQAANGSGVYGEQWGDIESVPPLRFIRHRYLDPFVDPAKTAVEIGPGGGRWTRYLLGFQRVYAVDYHKELLDELARNIQAGNLIAIHNNGSDFPGVPDRSIDFIFSFGTFVHLEAPTLTSYLANMHRVLAPGANVVLHYADQNKVMARENPGFADMDPERMRQLVEGAGYTIVDEDTTTMWHSGVVRFTPTG